MGDIMAKVSFAQRMRDLFGGRDKDDEALFDDLTDALIEGDVGAKAAVEIADALKVACQKNHVHGKDEVMRELEAILLRCVKATALAPVPGKTNVWMLLGVNGVGKTTTSAKLANIFKDAGYGEVVLASADTFRAAAIEQLALHGKNLGVRVVSHQHGSDPAAVVFDAADAVRAQGGGLVLADTAGRLHNKENLVRELGKIDRTCLQKADEGCYKRILVVDATTGQNAFRQAEVFGEAVPVDALVLTKYDSTAKGGIAVSVGKELGLPVAFVCTGEKYGDIAPFCAERYVKEFLGLE